MKPLTTEMSVPKVFDFKVIGLKCDAPGCGYRDDTIKVGDYKKWIDKPCPKCGASLLTKADYDLLQYLFLYKKIVNAPIIRHLIGFLSKDKKQIKVIVSMNGTGKIKLKEEDK
jgi:hypothetical protein